MSTVEPDNMERISVESRTIESATATEFYLTVTTDSDTTAQEQLRGIFTAIQNTLRERDASIQSERVFVASHAAPMIESIRAECYADWDDGVKPACLIAPVSDEDPVAVVQVYAISGVERPTILFLDGQPRARVIRRGGNAWLSIGGLSAPDEGSPAEQARCVFEQARAILQQAGGDLSSVARTWFWLRDIATWYDDFNAVRNEYFTRYGLIDPQHERTTLPASTGIGGTAPSSAFCTMDLLAVLRETPSIQYVDKTEAQRSAHQYGSAFSRAVKARTPGGETAFISGTAAIDADGHSQHVGQAHRQIEATLDHARAALTACGCRDDYVLCATAYCKNEEVKRVFLTNWSTMPWPQATVIADVCREELLFEIELTASTKASRS